MKNYIQPGNVLTLTSAFGVKSGDVVLLNKFFGVANYDCPIPGNPIEVSVVGVYSLPKKPTAVFAVGAPAYWDGSTGAGISRMSLPQPCSSERQPRPPGRVSRRWRCA